MNDGSLVSIILPTFNRAELLPRAIQSVLKQTYSNWELIIWDDGSIDHTKEIVRSYDHPNIRNFYGSNHGAYYARNRAMKLSRGKYLAFLDSDDEWVENKLATQVEIMEAHPEIDILFSDFINIDVTNNTSTRTFDRYAHAMKLMNGKPANGDIFIIKSGILESLAAGNCIATDSVLLRRDLVFKKGFFYEHLRNSEDFEYWWRLGLAGVCFAYVKKVLLLRYKYPRSLSSKSIVTIENYLKTLELCSQETIQAGRNEMLHPLQLLHRNAWQNMLSIYGANGDIKGMSDAFIKSMRYGFSLGSIRLLMKGILRL